MIVVDITQYEPFECHWSMHLRNVAFATIYFAAVGRVSKKIEKQIEAKNARISMYLELLGEVK